MKVTIRTDIRYRPGYYRDDIAVQDLIDDILLWGMENEYQVDHYLTRVNDNYWELTFTVEPEAMLMFVMVWDASHKVRPKNRAKETASEQATNTR